MVARKKHKGGFYVSLSPTKVLKIALVLAISVIAILLLLGVRSRADAQTASEWSHGPTVPVIVVPLEDPKPEFLAAGAGYAIRWNQYPTPDGTIRWLTVSFPTYVSVASNEVRTRHGALIETFNGLLGLGVIVDGVDTVSDTGLFLGEVSKRNAALVLAFGFNFGSGTPAATVTKATQAPTGPPPMYLKCW